jgi:hypothetical protein
MDMSVRGKQHIWPSLADWDSHRGIITRLYRDENNPLKHVVAIMRDSHNFYATRVLHSLNGFLCNELTGMPRERMYKTRVKNWKLEKKMKANEVAEILQGRLCTDGAEHTAVYVVRGRRIDARRVEKYLKRRPARLSRLQQTQLMRPETHGSIDYTLPRVDSHNQFCQSPRMLRAPDMLHKTDEILRLVHRYIVGSLESRRWQYNTYADIFENCTTGTSAYQKARDFEKLWIVGSSLVISQKYAEGFKVLDSGFRNLNGVVKAEDPFLLLKLWRIVAKSSQSQIQTDLARRLLYQFHHLSDIIHGANNPLTLISGRLLAFGEADIIPVAVTVDDAATNQFEENLPGRPDISASKLARKLHHWIFVQQVDPHAVAPDFQAQQYQLLSMILSAPVFDCDLLAAAVKGKPWEANSHMGDQILDTLLSSLTCAMSTDDGYLLSRLLGLRGSLRRDIGLLKEAEQDLEESVRVSETTFGNCHPITLRRLWRLISFYTKQGEHRKVQGLQQRQQDCINGLK